MDGEHNVDERQRRKGAHRATSTARHQIAATYSLANEKTRTSLAENDNYLLNACHTRGQRNLDQKTRRRHTITDTFGSFVEAHGEAKCLPVCLLLATLLAAVLNTLLLSFVVKSIGLNDKQGIMNGEVAWDERIRSTVLALPTRLAGKSISMKSIESVDDKPLRFEKLSALQPAGHGSEQQRHLHLAAGIAKAKALLFESWPPATGSAEASESRKANYMAVINVNNGQVRDEPVEIGANSFVLNLINGRSREPTNNNKSSPSWQQAHEGSPSRLLEFNGDQQSITLPAEALLRLHYGAARGSISAREVATPELLGSLEHNLNIQTRDGNLACRSEAGMRLAARSAGEKITAIQELELEAPALILSSPAHLYLAEGVQYYERAEEEPEGGTGGTGERRGQEKSSPRERTAASHLRAYNLVAINGLLMAAT